MRSGALLLTCLTPSALAVTRKVKASIANGLALAKVQPGVTDN